MMLAHLFSGKRTIATYLLECGFNKVGWKHVPRNEQIKSIQELKAISVYGVSGL